MRQLIILAAGGLAREAAEAVARGMEWDLIGFLDDEPALVGTEVCGRPVLGAIADIVRYPETSLLICAGSGQARRTIVRRLDELGVGADRYATVVAPDVVVPRSCRVGGGSILLSGTVLTADVNVGRHVVTMPGVVLTHDNQINDFATLCARVTLGGNVLVREAAYLGMGATVRERLEVGEGSTLGMGAVLLRDLPDGETWVGVPAQPLRPSVHTQEI